MDSIGIHHSILDTTGRTPFIRLASCVPDGAADVLVKVEGGNPTGSYKDRNGADVKRDRPLPQARHG